MREERGKNWELREGEVERNIRKPALIGGDFNARTAEEGGR